MEFLGLTLFQWLLPIMIGVVAGFVTNAVAIWMLFHPYQPVVIRGIRVFPKGAVPKEIDRIAKRIGETVGRELLTTEDIGRTLSSDAFRARFDEAIGDTVRGLLDRELPALREIVTPEQIAGLQEVLDRVVEKVLEGAEIYLASPEWEARVRGFSESLLGELRERPLSAVITPELHQDLLRGAARFWAGVRESPELQRLVVEGLDRGIRNVTVSEKPLRSYVPTGAANLGETVVAHYLPLLLERLGQALDDPATRAKLQLLLRRFVDRFLEEQRTWKRIVGRLVITERTLEQTVEAIEHGGVAELSTLLREAEVRERVARSVNEGVEDFLDRPVRELLENVSPERIERLRQSLVERVLYVLRHPSTEEILLRRLDGFLQAAEGKTIGDLVEVLGEERARDLSGRVTDWIVEAMRGPRTLRMVERTIRHQTEWVVSAPVGRISQYLPEDAERRMELLLFDPLWGFIQRRVPDAVAGLPIARIVEDKLRGYPIRKVEELIWRVSRRELVLIIYLGGFLGALVGSVMLFTVSVPAGLVATGFFLLLSFLFVNLKA
jgi:uncharacterized membrane protein YheB (UPF0754 family)